MRTLYLSFLEAPIIPTLMLFLASTLILTLTVGCSTIKSDPTAPGFEMSLYKSKNYPESEIYRFIPGQSVPLVVNFWFPSCPPCIAEMPEINQVYKDYQNQIDVVGIQLIGLDSVDDGKQFVGNTGISYAVGADTDGSISVEYKVSGFPTTFFINKKGKIVKTWHGAINADQMKENVNLILPGYK